MADERQASEASQEPAPGLQTFPDDPDELRRTWEKGFVFVPGPQIGEFIFGRLETPQVRRQLRSLPTARPFPLLLYLHDSAGPSTIEWRLLRTLEIESFALIYPDSFARLTRQGTRGQSTVQRPTTLEILRMRAAELIFALKQVQALPWVDKGNLFVMGQGEGAAAIALAGHLLSANGYVLSNPICGIAGLSEAQMAWHLANLRPLLLIRGSGPPGQDGGRTGACRLKREPGRDTSQLVIDTRVDNLLDFPQSIAALIGFLYRHRRSQ